MFRKPKNPLSGEPWTRASADANGNPVFSITVVELTPLRARIADALGAGVLILLVLHVLFVVILHHGHRNASDWGIAAVIIVAAFFITASLLRAALLRVTLVRMSAEAICVWRWYGWQRYDRNLDHRFALVIHDRAGDEARKHELATRRAAARGRVIQPTAYYGESCHVVLNYAGHRQDLMSVYGRKEAANVLARLQYCDRRLNDALQMGGGIGGAVDDDWQDAAGGLNDA